MDMEQWARVHRKILVEGQSKRSVLAEEGLHWETLQKMLSHSRPPRTFAGRCIAATLAAASPHA